MKTASITHPNFVMGQRPGVENLLKSAVGWWDAKDAKEGAPFAKNNGSGGSILNARYGSLLGNYVKDGQAICSGLTNNYWSISDSAILDVDDLDISFQFTPDVGIPPAEETIVSKSDNGIADRSWEIRLRTNGQFYIVWSTTGVAGSTRAVDLGALTDNTTYWLRFIFDVDDGASGRSTKAWKVQSNSWDEPIWSATPTAQYTDVGVTSIFKGTSPVRIGTMTPTIEPYSGNVGRVIQRGTIGGAIILDVDFSKVQDFVSSFVCTTGQTVSLTTTSSDTNDPMLLTHTGANYIYFPPTGAGNSIAAVIPSAQCPSGDIEIIADLARENWGASAPVGHQLLWSNTPGTFDITLYGDTIYVSFFSGSYRSNNAVASIIGNGFIDGERIQIKVARISSTGAITFAWKRPADSAWSAFGFTNQSVLYAGALTPWGASDTFTTTDNVANGVKLYSLRVNNGIAGSAIYEIRGTEYVSSQSTFVATSGQTVIVGRAPTGRKTTLVTRPIWLFGTDDYLEVLDNDLIDFNLASTDMTVIGIFRYWNTQVGFSYPMWTKNTSLSPTGNKGYSVRFNGSVPKFDSAWGDGNAAGNFNQFGALGADVPVQGALELWGQLAQAGAGRSLRNNVVYSTVVVTGFDMSNTSNLKIVSSTDLEMCAFAIFRRALTTAEIAAINNYYGTA